MAFQVLDGKPARPQTAGYHRDDPDLFLVDDFSSGITAWTGATRALGGPNGGYYIKATAAAPTAFYRKVDPAVLELNQAYHVTFWAKMVGGVDPAAEMSAGISRIRDTSWTLRNVVMRMPKTLPIILDQFQLAFSLFAGHGELYVSDIRMEKITSAEFAAYADAIMTGLGAHCRPFTDPSRLALLPRTVDKLTNGGTLSVLSLGDSWQGTHSYSAYNALLERSFPLCTVVPYLLNSGGAGMDFWDDNLGDIEYWMDLVSPDLVYLGGISDLANEAAWTAVVNCIRAKKPTVEIMAGGVANGLGETGAIPGGGTGDGRSAQIEQIAANLNLAFFPAGQAMNNFLTDSGRSLASILCDGVHLDELGQQVLAEGFAWFLGAGR